MTMDLLALADFNLVARHGGFGPAARASGRPKATLSRRVADLEAGLELRLFERGARALKLTQEGQALYERTAVLLTELDESAAAIAAGGSRPQGRLRISAPLLFTGWLAASLLIGDVLDRMGFTPIVRDVRTMDPALFATARRLTGKAVPA